MYAKFSDLRLKVCLLSVFAFVRPLPDSPYFLSLSSHHTQVTHRILIHLNEFMQNQTDVLYKIWAVSP